MDDLKLWLSTKADILDGISSGTAQEDVAFLRAAFDRIERLEAALRRIATLGYFSGTCARIARRALDGEE